MSKRRDNIQHQKLKELLDKKNSSGGQAMDDFDKEALEGFAMLKDSAEITDLKEELDRKMIRVFTDEKRSGKPLYWFAAAGLLLIIGFSVYFIQSGNAVKNDDLSIHSQPPSATGEALQQSIAKETEKNKDLEFKQQEPAKKDEPREEEREEVGKNKAGKSRQDPAAPEMTDLTSVAAAEATAPGEAAPTSGYSKGSVSENQPQPPASPALDLAKEGKNEEQKDFVLDEVAEDKVSRQEVVVLSQKESSGEPSNRKKTQKTRADNAPAGDGGAKDQDAVTYNAPASAGAPAPQIAVIQAYYAGGETALNKELRLKLTALKLDQKFDAILFINAQKKVEKVEFVKAYDLDKKQQKQVMEILKNLDKFIITAGSSSGKELIPYRLNYRP